MVIERICAGARRKSPAVVCPPATAVPLGLFNRMDSCSFWASRKLCVEQFTVFSTCSLFINEG
jgi:hypothetical protein